MSSARRVLLVEANDDGTVGGSHRCLFDLCRKLDRARFEPTVVFYQDNAYAARLRALGIRVEVWDQQRGKERGRLAPAPFRTLSLAYRTSGAVRRRVSYLRRERFELVHLNNSPAMGFSDWLPAARVRRIPCVTHAREAYRPPGGPLGRWLSRRYDRVVAISRYVAQSLLGAGFDDGRIRQIYDGIDLAEWSALREHGAIADRAEFGIRPETMLVVMVGHLRAWKGQDAVLAAVALLPPEIRRLLHVLFVGDAPAGEAPFRERLAATVRRHALQGSVTFAGHRTDVPALMRSADVVLHASTVPEPLGLVVLEGMALGKLVVASSLGGPSEIVTQGAGLTFDPREPEQLAGILASACREPELRRAGAAAALERVKDFDLRTNVSGICRVWDELLR